MPPADRAVEMISAKWPEIGRKLPEKKPRFGSLSGDERTARRALLRKVGSMRKDIEFKTEDGVTLRGWRNAKLRTRASHQRRSLRLTFCEAGIEQRDLLNKI